MTMRRATCLTAAFIALIGFIALIAASGATPASRNDGPPTSIAALGDSITAAACADGASCADALPDSWSTGTNPAVQSHLRRLKAIWKSHPVRAFNLASDAHVTMADLPAQALQARNDQADYVTIEIGENDLCGNTATATFKAELKHGLAVLEGGAHAKRIPPKILLLSIENIVAHWRVLHANPTARKVFKSGYTLDCALGEQVPASWLAQIQARVRTLNTIEAEVCSSVPYCLYDGGTYFHLPLQARYFSPADYQHLSLAGQRALAAAEWKIALKILYD